MIGFSPEAERQFDALVDYYRRRGRAEAIDRMVESLERASARFKSGRGLFYDAPRPYPDMVLAGWRWTKEGRYWIAFHSGSGLILAIYYESANIPGRVGGR